MTGKRPALPATTVAALIGLAIGLGAGAAIHASGNAVWTSAALKIGVIGTLWTHALRLLVLPLVITNLVVAIARMHDARALGRIGGLALLVFAAMLAAGAIFTLLAVPPLLARFSPGAGMLASLHAARAAPAPPAAGSAADWILALVPTNFVQAASGEDILPIVLLTVAFAVALTRLGAEPRARMLGFFEAAFEAVLVMLGWVVALSPVGVFALALELATRTGASSAGAFGFWVALVSGLMLAFTALLYPVTAWIGRVPLSRFARAALPAQTVAVGTRSSIASLPALMEGAEARLGLPAEVAGFAIPLAVSTFKLNRTISSIAKLMFLAAAYRVHLDPAHVATFALIIGIFSFSTPGIPSAGTVQSTPAYLAAGIPLEGVVLLNAVDAIPDIFKTLLNVTSDLSAAAILARLTGKRAVAVRPAA